MSVTLRPDFPSPPSPESGDQQPRPMLGGAAPSALELELRLALSAFLPPRIRNARTADFDDIASRQLAFATVSMAYADFIQHMLSELASNLPIGDLYVSEHMHNLRGTHNGIRDALHEAKDRAYDR